MLLRATHLCHSEEQSNVRISRKGILISRFFGTAKDDAKMRRLLLVPKTGLEPVRMLLRGILSPLRLPIPPLRRLWRHHPESNRG